MTKGRCAIPDYVLIHTVRSLRTTKNGFYFILSSEIMENISAIKIVSIYSEMIWYHFTVD